jgi:glucose-1-phosphate adenylyltransferase
MRSVRSSGPAVRDNSRVIALVLAYGQGRRLMPLTADRARSAVPFGGTYRLIDFALSNLVNGRIGRIAVLTQYKSHSLNRHIAMAWQLSPMVGEAVTTVPAQMRMGPHWFAGSADAIYQNLYLLRETCPDHVFVLPSDHVYRMDPRQLIQEHHADGAAATVAVVRVPIERTTGADVVELDRRGRVTAVRPQSVDPKRLPAGPGQAFVSTGICVFRAGTLAEAVTRDASNPWSRHDLGTVLGWLAERGGVAAYDLARNQVPGSTPNDHGYWQQIGDLDNYFEASMELVSRQPAFNLYNRQWPIYGWQPQPLAPATFTPDAVGRRGQAIDCLVSPGVLVAGGTVRRSILSPDVVVQESAHVEDCVLLNRVEVGRGAVLCRAIIDKDVRIPPGFRLGADGDPDRRRFHVSKGGVVAIAKRQAVEQRREVAVGSMGVA